jgi:hypothetical protein
MCHAALAGRDRRGGEGGNTELRQTIARLEAELAKRSPAPAPKVLAGDAPSVDFDAVYAEVKRRAQNDPGVLQLLREKPELVVELERKVVKVDGSTTKGRVGKLLAEGFYDLGASNSGTRAELKRTGADVNNALIAKILSELTRDGFLTLEGDRFKAVPDMKVNVVMKGEVE